MDAIKNLLSKRFAGWLAGWKVLSSVFGPLSLSLLPYLLQDLANCIKRQVSVKWKYSTHCLFESKDADYCPTFKKLVSSNLTLSNLRRVRDNVSIFKTFRPHETCCHGVTSV